MNPPPPLGASFPPAERRLLLATPGLGPVAVMRIEALGITSLTRLDEMGADAVARDVCATLGTAAWSNRRAALARALQAARARCLLGAHHQADHVAQT